MEKTADTRTYHVRNSERCFRFKPEAFFAHGPERLGIYELVTFDQAQNATVLYVGAAFDRTIRDCLEAHAAGTLAPAADDILAKYPNLYFDYLDQTDAKTREDAQDIYWWLVQKHKPAYNDASAVQPSGRTASVDVVEE